MQLTIERDPAIGQRRRYHRLILNDATVNGKPCELSVGLTPAEAIARFELAAAREVAQLMERHGVTREDMTAALARR